MADEGDPQITIVTRFETDSSGADQAVGDAQRIGDAARAVGDDGAAAGEKFDSAILANRRTASHFLRGLMELQEGGVGALGGLATEAFVATEAFEMMLGPLYPLIATVTLLTSLGIPLFERWADRTDKAKESTDGLKKSEEALADASDKASERRIAAIGRIIDAIKQEVENAESYNASLAREEGYNQKAVEDTNKLIDARAKLAVAELEHERLLALGNAKTKDEVDAINARFNNLKDGTQSQAQADVLSNKITASAEEIGSKIGSQNRLKDELAPLIQELQARRDNAQGASQAAIQAGVLPDSQGSFSQARKDLAAEQASLIVESEAKPRDQSLKEQLADIGSKLALANRADDDTQALAKFQEEIGPQIGKLSEEIENLGSEIADAKATNQQLQIEQATASQDAQNKKLAAQQAADEKAAKDAYDEREAQRKAQIEDLQKQLGARDIAPDKKASIQAKIDQTEIAGYQDDLSSNGKSLTDAQKIEIQGRIKGTQESENVQGHNAQLDDLKRQIEQLKKDLAARPDHQSLQPFIAAAERQGDLALEASQLQGLANQAIGAFVISQTAKNAKQEQINAENKRSIQDLRRKIDNQGNHG